MVRVTGLDHVHLGVADLDRAVEFYATVFGAEEMMRFDELVFLRLSDSGPVVALDARPADRRNPPHVGLVLPDGESLDSAAQAVEDAGGRVVERGEHAAGVPYAYVADPDGNVLEL